MASFFTLTGSPNAPVKICSHLNSLCTFAVLIYAKLLPVGLARIGRALPINVNNSFRDNNEANEEQLSGTSKDW